MVRTMKQIKFTIKPNQVGRENKMHLDAQIKFPHLIQKDKTKYTRKIKHKNKSDY